jgi:hypothetical protein
MDETKPHFSSLAVPEETTLAKPLAEESSD